MGISEGNPFKLNGSTHGKLIKVMNDMYKKDGKIVYFDEMLNRIVNEYAKNHRIEL